MIRQLGLGVVALLMTPLLLLSSAVAQDAPTGPVITGTLKSPSGEGLAGVSITVEGNGFSETVTSNEAGEWQVLLPDTGAYQVTLDISTLPEGISLTSEDRAVTSATVISRERPKRIGFPLIEGDGAATVGGGGSIGGAGFWGQAAQLTVDGLAFGLVIALGAVGLSLVYGTTKLVNFAHGELLALGGLLAYFFSVLVGLPVLIAIPVAVVASAFLGGYAQNLIVWKPLRKRGTGLTALLVVSIGLALFLQYLFLFLFGGRTRILPGFAGQAGIDIGPVAVTPRDMIAAAGAVVLLALTFWWLGKTQSGKATRAVADNPALASASGINVEKVITTVWVIAAGLGGYAGIMFALSNGVSWQLGVQLLLLIFAGVILGGLGTAIGALVGSLIVGVFIQLSVLFIPSELKYVGALVVLIIVLLIRPQGILGRKERVG
jgi:branched-chain amino acid transport system permease protein